MKVREFLEHVSYGDLSAASVISKYRDTDPVKRDAALQQLLSYTNLGVMTLHRKFELRTTVLVKDVNKESPVVEIRETNVGLLLDVLDDFGNSLVFPTIVGDLDYDISQISKNTFLLKNRNIERILLVYTVTPATLKDIDDEIDVPDLMIEALLQYVTYRGFAQLSSSLNETPTRQSNIHLDRFRSECDLLVLEGFNVLADSRAKSVGSKGFY